MPDLPGMPSSITCPSCGFENATTSLYCQDCGVRLVKPPSAIPGESDPATPVGGPQTPPTRRKPRILSVERSNPIGKILLNSLGVIIFAALAALVILVFREPADLPPEDPPLAAGVVENIRAAIVRNAQAGKPINAPWAGQGVNAFVAGTIAVARPDITARLASDNNGFVLFVRHTFASLHVYTTTHYQLVARGNGIGVTRTSAAIGRLPVPKWISPAMDWADAGVAQALSPDIAIIRNATTVRTNAQGVSVIFSASPQ
jgi:hypothetical protein